MNNYFNEYSKILLRQDTFAPTLSLSNALNVFNSNIHYWYNYFIEQNTTKHFSKRSRINQLPFLFINYHKL